MNISILTGRKVVRNIVKQRKVDIHHHILTTETDQDHPIDRGLHTGQNHHIVQKQHTKINTGNLKRRNHGRDQETKTVIRQGVGTEIILEIDINHTIDILGHGDLALDLSQERKDLGKNIFKFVHRLLVALIQYLLIIQHSSCEWSVCVL